MKTTLTRWRFLDQTSPKEVAYHNYMLAKIDAWWKAFEAQAEQIDAHFRRGADLDLPAFMKRHLQAIHPKLMWEFGAAVRGKGHRLVITPETARPLRPLTATILERAPRLSGWEFYAYRLAEDLAMAQQTVQARTSGDLTGAKARASIGKHHLIDLCYYSPRTMTAEDSQAFNDAFVATETLLGEECLDKWVGAIEVRPLEVAGRAKKTLVPLDRLKETVDGLIGSVYDQLPDRPHHEWSESCPWSGIKLKPREAEDYPGQTDLFVATTCNRVLWETAHGGAAFYSGRFSRCQETFCFVKLDGSAGLNEEKFADKGEIEDALDAVLKPKKLGCHIGGGTGLRYSYIDLALTKVEPAIKAIRKRLQAGNVPRRSWLLFFDADLVGEWVGIYDDSPPPLLELAETPNGVAR